MSRPPLVSRLGRLCARFATAEQGNIAVIFAIALVPVLSFVGAAIDYSRAAQARASMQSALDSTALMLSRDLSSGTITTSQISSKAQTYFNALFTNTTTLPSVTVGATYTASTSIGSTIQLTGTGTYTTSFMKIAGFPTLGIDTTSTSAWGLTRMRVALVLDVTGSMADDGKMPAMQTAAKNLVDQLSTLAKTNGDVYISVVPFSKDVNVGSSNYDKSWIDWSDWEAVNGSCSDNWYKQQSSCVSAGKTWTPKNHNKWTGCVTDRDQDYDTKNTAPVSSNSSTLFPAEQYSYCNSSNSAYIQPIMPLSYDWSALKTLIGNLVPTGNTNQGIGLAWGWMTLSTGDPMNAPAKDTNYTYKDAIVLLSDGMNTQNRWYSDSSQIDAREKKLCDNAKAQPNNITIYTVQVNTGSDPTSSVLQYCASSSDKFYLVTSASQTVSVFKDIGTSLSKLRVAR
ncbi:MULTISPECIES: TadE/TadG family type IV pilus assembly protein [Bradyrhizobium]|jgi:Flp pilus assembly protein TadG|uniref:Flp pilus assembly protein TadG n=2 Tax=Bradyrhizobium TaxID=374 RepID=A0ABV4G0C5_9BRAD|nr:MULTISPECIES: TadE/TadG family type IV pilus assembly protein [Bradyrhizobium]MBR1294141.1 TadE/TadG family protein [Bradyrhizobium ottawaense]MBR1325288.1 TadE/TadG family protein [Bradyrhizobium ottawaense]MBR1336476.1 TadE/TadG family protein [Bradyrhizobium ottawaense]MBR1361996.1 TadE/TadG family protein [Bradyrhizobium ottawaense]MDA9414516.1 pilus assembly protein TadG [Bradyrhizobium sp. CCBAU 25360]